MTAGDRSHLEWLAVDGCCSYEEANDGLTVVLVRIVLVKEVVEQRILPASV